jgi:hypothetical protein
VRERGAAERPTCPFCAAIFTRKSNRDAHVDKGRCRGLGRWLSREIEVLAACIASHEQMLGGTAGAGAGWRKNDA